MKNLLVLGCLCLSLVCQAQFVVDDPLANKKLTSQLLKWIQDYTKQTGQKINLEKILSENKTTQEKITALLELKKEIEVHLYSIKDFKKLRMSDLSRIIEEVYGMGSASDYIEGFPFMETYHTYVNGPTSIGNANELYNFFLGGTGVYMPESSGSYQVYQHLLKEQKAKEYGINLAAQKRKMAASMSYKRLAQEFTKLAEDLSAQINTAGEHRMTTGERIKSQKIANDYLVKSLELKAKSDQLIKEALEKTPALQEVDQSRQQYLNRKALTQIEIN